MPPAVQPSQDLNQSLGVLYRTIRSDLQCVETSLHEQLRSDHPLVDEIIRHGVRLGGKRLRPALLLLAGQATGSTTDEHIILATIMEMIHTATLIHDDVLDEATIRRHADTVNARWNNETSVLLGDFLFTHAFYLASTLGSTYACRAIGRATNVVCEGELQQTVTHGNLELSEEDYFAIISSKTAELCACCCQLGAHYAGAETDTVHRLADFGRNLGIAFQIVDDLLDLEGTETVAGKSLGSDLAKRKMTLPLIHARDSRVGQTRRDFLDLLGQDGQPDTLRDIHAELRRFLSLDYARAEAQKYISVAREQIDTLPAGDARDSLYAMCEFTLARTA